MRLSVVRVVKECRARMQDGPDVIHNFSMCLHDIKVESVRVLAFEVSQKRLAKSGCLHHTANALSSEEGVKFRDGAVEGLGGGSALEFKVHLLDRPMCAVVCRACN